MIYLTEKASAKIAEISDAEGIEHQTVRAKCMGGGCAGFQFDLSFDDQINELDEISEQDDIKVICDPISFQYLDETSIDYVDGIMGGFKFNVPKSKSSCGCGHSFSF